MAKLVVEVEEPLQALVFAIEALDGRVESSESRRLVAILREATDELLRFHSAASEIARRAIEPEPTA